MSRFQIFTTAMCPYCVSAKQFITRKGWEFEEIRVDLNADRREEMLARSGGRRTVPQIFIGQTHIGGFDDLVAADRAGHLSELVENVK